MALFVAQVADQLSFGLQLVKSQQMRPAQIVYMDVVTYTCPVWSIVVGSVNFYIVAFSHCCLDGQRNQMGFWLMILTYSGIVAGAACVEISQRGKCKFSRLALVVTHSFDSQFRLAVGIDRLGR